MADRRSRPPAWAVAAGVAAVPAAGLVWAAGVDGGHAAGLVLGAAVLVAVAVWSVTAGSGSGAWPEPPAPTHGVGWHQVALTAAALGRADDDPRRAGSLVDDRLRTLAATPRPGRESPDPAEVRTALARRDAAARVDALLDVLDRPDEHVEHDDRGSQDARGVRGHRS